VAPGEPGDAGAVRDVDLQARYPFSKGDLVGHTGLTPPKTTALRHHLGIDGNEAFHHRFVFGHSAHDCYSQAALKAMRDALDAGLDMEEVWTQYRARGRA
jgi:hypothetical protein